MLSPEIIVLITVGVPALIGALLLGWLWREPGQRTVTGAAVGALSAGLGAMLFMVPLNFCTFEAERSTADAVFGAILVVFGAIIGLFAGRFLMRILTDGMSLDALLLVLHRW